MLNSIPIPLQAALVAAAVSLVVLLAGELFKRNSRRQEKRDQVKHVFKRYADPLASASTTLLWRLHEVFDENGKGYYLHGSQHETKYEHYKVMSTLYRLACLLGWIQALRRELVFVHGPRPKKVAQIENALNRFAGCLAEGGHVERTKVDSLAKLWNIEMGRIGQSAIDQTGVRLDYIVKRKIHEHQVTKFGDFTKTQSNELRNNIANTLSDGLGVPPIDRNVLNETHARAMQYLDVREAWIYRDWQTAIGDVMLRSATTGTVRVYEVIGYREFELICESERMMTANGCDDYTVFWMI